MSASEGQLPQTYTQEEVQQILHLAIAQGSEREELSREQLWEIATELEIDGATLQKAELDWLNGRFLDKKRQEFNLYRREVLKNKAIRYAIVNGFLLTIDLIAGGGLSWSMYILLFWGIGLSLATWRTFQSRGDAYEQAFQKWNLKNEMKQSMIVLWNKLKKAWQTS
jgi:hypothetical protein